MEKYDSYALEQDTMEGLYEAEELKSTLKHDERQAIWNFLEKRQNELRALKSIAQNPMPLRGDDVMAWSKDVNELITKLMQLDANVNKLMLAKGIIA